MKKTMKQHSFTSQLKSLAVVFGIALTFASCANEDVAQNPTNPNEDNDKNLTTFVAGEEAKTRTSMDYTSGNFYWEADDYIYVKDDNNVLQKSTNAPTSKVAAFKYKVPGKFAASSSYKVYYLGKNSDGTSVSISTTQSQTAPDNTAHFGTAGDYGTATATKVTGKNQFKFELEHQPAYLVFQPYTSNTILHNCYLTKVEVSSDNDIAEKYTVNPTTGALDASTVTNGKQIVLTTRDPTWGSSNYNGFPLTNNSASVTTNGAYMVIKPGTHTLRVRYWVKDVATNVEGTITKTLPATAYASNTYYDMTANLNVKDYDGDHYYMWDAQQQYWYGYEWTKHLPGNTGQPTLRGYTSPNYAQNNTDSRYYNDAYTYGIAHSATHASFNSIPNVNEMLWYALKGDPRWDNDELWTTMGHLYKGGIWIKKKTYINGYSANKAPDGIDWQTNGSIGQDASVSRVLPSIADIGNYFYLPALGSYTSGGLNLIGFCASFWSSSADLWDRRYAYYLTFSPSLIGVGCNYGYRYLGYRAQPFSDFGDN